MMPDIVDIIHRSFATVAEELGLTRRNCPGHPAFLPHGELARTLLLPGVICFGGFADEEMADTSALAGFAAMWPKARHIYELTRLCVAPERRHAGLGRLLMDEAARRAKAEGARKIAIDVIDENVRLKAWYLAYGFRETGKHTYPHLPFTVCEMELDIIAPNHLHCGAIYAIIQTKSISWKKGACKVRVREGR